MIHVQTCLDRTTKLVIPSNDNLDLHSKVVVGKMPFQSRDKQEIESIFPFPRNQLLGNFGLLAIPLTGDRVDRGVNLTLSS